MNTIWVVFKDNVKSKLWSETEFRFSSEIEDLKTNELVLVDTKYGNQLAKFTRYGMCEKPELLKKLICRTNVVENN